MRGGRVWLATGLLVVVSGCQAVGRPRTVASVEPPLATSPEAGASVVETQPTKSVTWVDRHPLFNKPRQYYESSGDNKVAKVAAATVIGIPAGIVGELKQIVVGAPAEPHY